MKLKTKVCACRLYYYIILLDFCSLWFRVDVWLFVSVVCFSAQQTETISNLARCLTCWIPKRAATRSCPTGPNQHPTPPCATWRWRILCVQGEQLLSEAGLWGSGLWELLLHPTRGSPNMQDTPKKKKKKAIFSNQNRLLPQPCFISLLAHQHNSTLIMHCHSSWLSASQLAHYKLVTKDISSTL